MHIRNSGTELTMNGLLDQLCVRLDTEFGDGQTDFTQFQTDPVSFGEEVLGERYTDDVKRMMESVRDNPTTIARSANATGKTHGAARVAVWWHKCFPGNQVFTAAAPPESNLKKLLWGEIGSIIEKNSDLFKGETVTNLHVHLSAQSFLTGVTIPMSGTEAQRQAKFSGKHAPYLLFIIDEGDAVPDEVYTAIESCMSGGHARLLIMFNPRAEAGEVYRMERDKRANIVTLSALNHPNVLSGADEIPGAVTRETTIRRIYEWCRPLAYGETPDSECFELPSFLEGAMAKSQSGQPYPPLKSGWYKITEPAFSYMVLGRYPGQGSTKLIAREWVNRARARWDAYVTRRGEIPPAYTRATMGQDVAEYGSDANVACFRYGGYVERLVTWSGIDVTDSADRAASEYKSRQVTHVNVDATGLGAGVPGMMQRQGCSATPIKVANSPTERTDLGEFRILRDQIWWACREWLRTDPGAMLPPDELLIEELLAPSYEVENGKIRVTKKDVLRELLKRSPDRADALTLTFAPSGFSAGLDLS